MRIFISYIQLFDSDRSKLGAAYAKDALFSCRVHHVQDSTAGLFAPEMKPSFRSSHLPESMLAVEQGRTQICDRLHKMGPYMFGARPKTEVFYDMATPLLFGAEDGVLVSVHGEVANINVTNPQLDHVLTVDQSFVLRRRSDVDSDINGYVLYLLIVNETWRASF
ncbi:hypothetical protein BDZ97DRAFT_1820664 [Flammula alnicola]|nr:hypothetical protein BDZ97DRAFT_1820664 [Flammula alnicola]